MLSVSSQKMTILTNFVQKNSNFILAIIQNGPIKIVKAHNLGLEKSKISAVGKSQTYERLLFPVCQA